LEIYLEDLTPACQVEGLKLETSLEGGRSQVDRLEQVLVRDRCQLSSNSSNKLLSHNPLDSFFSLLEDSILMSC